MQRNYLRLRTYDNDFVAVAEFINTLENITMNYISDSFPVVWDKIHRENQSSLRKDGYGYFELDCKRAIKLIRSEQRYIERNPPEYESRKIPKRAPYYRLSDIIQLFLLIENIAEKLKDVVRLYKYLGDEWEYCRKFTKEVDASLRNLIEAISEAIKEIHWKISNTYSDVYGYKETEFTIYIAGTCIFPLSSSTKEIKKHCYDYVACDGSTIKYEKRGLMGDLSRASRIGDGISKYVFQDGSMDDKELIRTLTQPIKLRHKQIISVKLAQYTEKQKIMRERVEPLIKNNTELKIALGISKVEIEKTQEMLKLVESQRDDALKASSLQSHTLFIKDREISELKVSNQLLEKEAKRKFSSIRNRRK